MDYIDESAIQFQINGKQQQINVYMKAAIHVKEELGAIIGVANVLCFKRLICVIIGHDKISLHFHAGTCVIG